MHWGNGYGTEAAAGCMRYAKDVLHKKSLVSLILAVNRQSIRVAEKNGMIFERNYVSWSDASGVPDMF
jgi:RimJ/RimL family protein N-acetyltransferase